MPDNISSVMLKSSQIFSDTDEVKFTLYSKRISDQNKFQGLI